MKWERVTKKRPCEICRRHDWCTYAPESGLILCMRVESDRPSNNSMGGWLHNIGEPRPFVWPKKVTVELPPQDFHGMWRRWFEQTDHYHVDGFAMSLGVDTDCLQSLGCAWTGKAWAFPMKNADKKIIGIRLRDNEGNKWAVKGSKQGLFIPDTEPKKVLYITEGPTDTAAALTLKLFAVGRPSCMGCEEMIKQFVRIQRINRVVIITDNDIPGLRGAAKLQRVLPAMSCAWSPPAKDLRAFVNAGGTRQMLHAMTKDLIWQQPY